MYACVRACVQVKRSRHPSAVWAHAAAPGERARVRVGGGFVPSAAELAGPLLLLAGGIGITPLASIARHAADVAAAAAAAAAAAHAPAALRPPQPQTLLVYSCRSADDFALLPQLRAAEAASGAPAQRQSRALAGLRALTCVRLRVSLCRRARRRLAR
jgi:hypothetical protein